MSYFSEEEKLVLSKVRNLFQDPNKFCRFSMAKSLTKKEVLCDSPEAVSWCFLGALNLFGGLSVELFNKLRNIKFFDDFYSLSYINDQFGRLKVLEFLDFALSSENPPTWR